MRWIKGLTTSLGIAVLALLLFYAFLYLNQRALIFPGASADRADLAWARARFPQAERWFEMEDGTRLHGWLAEADRPNAPLLIFFGGNAEDVTGLLREHWRFPNWSWLLVNYRGFGLSEGEPAEDRLFSDARRLYDLVVWPPGERTVAAWGRSLGAGVAVHLAAARPLDAVVLATPYDSIRALAERHYPIAPVGLLLEHPFDAIALAPAIQTQMLALAARDDRVIPWDHAKRLSDAWGGPNRLILLPPGNGHNLLRTAAYWNAMGEFLARIKGRRAETEGGAEPPAGAG